MESKIKEYEIRVRKRVVKNITIKVKSSKEVEVIVPKSVSELYLKSILEKRENWIKKNLYKMQLREENRKNQFFLPEHPVEIFQELINKYLDILKEEINSVKLKKMTSRWGSCNYKTKSINLNLELLKKPLESIEYVVLHELCHLKYPHHQREFWEYLEIYMPDWRERRAKLKN